MDKVSLELSLIAFKAACEKEGRPVTAICLEEAYPGVASTSFIVNIMAPWVKDLCCSDALDILVPILFKSVSLDDRKQIFALKVTDDENTVECFENSLTSIEKSSRSEAT